MRSIAFVILFFLSGQVGASTFVGNGGNAGDVELQITLTQIEGTFKFIEKNKADKELELCQCSKTFEGRPVCEILKKLSEEQVKACQKHLIEKGPELVELLSQKKIGFSWTHDTIEVRENGELRGVDAVTNPAKMSMTLSQERYLKMNQVDRLFLVSHELMHLTKSGDKYLEDEGDIGPFTGANGGRQFINAMAAAMVVAAEKYGAFEFYESAIRRSKGYKDFWVSGSLLGSEASKDTSSPYIVNQYSGAQVEGRYQLTYGFGVLVQYTYLEGKKTTLSTIKSTETKNILGLGAAYRWFPFSNPVTFSGQSHFVFKGTVDLMASHYDMTEDPYLNDKEDTQGIGATVSCNYFIPFAGGLWGYGGIGYSTMKYKYDKLDIDYKKDAATVNLGVSYGF